MRSPRQRSRRFSTLDMAILLASTAAGLVWLWLADALQIAEITSSDFEERSFKRFYLNVLPSVALFADPFLTTWTLAWLALRFRGTRPRWRRLAIQPGIAVGFVAILAWLAGGIVTLRWGADVHHGTPGWIAYGYVLLASSTMLGGFGVCVAWAGSVLDGHWRPESGWADRIGQALGFGWIEFSIPSGILLKTLAGPFY